MLAIDANLVVRYLVDDHKTQSARARALIDGQAVFIPVTSLLEADRVLRSVFGYNRVEVARALRYFAGLPTVTTEDSPLVADAFDLAESGMDFADALHLTRSTHCDGFATFDLKLVKAAKAAGYTTVRRA